MEEWKKDGFQGERMVVLPTEAFSEYVTHPLVQRLYLTDVGFFPGAKHHFRERVNGIEEYILIYCAEGQGTIVIENQAYTLHQNEAFCIPRFKKHYYYADEDDPWSILWVHFKGEDTANYPVDTCRVITLHQQHANNRMYFLFELLFRTLDDSYTLSNFIYISQVLALILAEVYYHQPTDQAQDYHVTEAIRYMMRHLQKNLTLEQLATEFHVSKSYLNAIFQKYTQHSPVEFFICLKMKKACELLRTKDLYVYEVAQRLGYTNQYYFSRLFKKVVGVSPQEYKKSEYCHYKE